MIKYTSQHRLCNDNKTIGTNIIMDLLPKSFEEHFEDIIDSDEKLRQNYIYARRPLSGRGIRINNLEEHYSNKIEQWSSVMNNWQPKQTDNTYSRDAIMKIVQDEAEFNLFDRIFEIVDYITVRNQVTNQMIQIQHVLPEKRLIFLQAGIGAGKTTMLHHFSRITLPDLAAKQLLPINFISSIVDFNPIDESKDMEVIWEEIVRDIRIKIENTTDMRNPAGWERIAQHEIFDEKGHYLPEIELAANREEEISQIVIKAKDDKVFLNRISRYLLNTHPQGVIVIIFDNLDMHGTENQLGYIRKLLHFIAGVENVIGIIATRECTVGNLNHLQEFQSYMHLDRMFMSTPYIGEMLSRRFESCIDSINETASRSVTIDLDNRNTTISQVDIRNILKHIHTAIDVETHNNNSKPAVELNESCTTLTQFLNHITNSNARNALQLVTHALKSWALDLTPIVTEYLWQRDRKISPIILPPFSIDEIIRLAAVGQRELYQQEGDEYIVNIFSIGNAKSEPENGKFPVLYMYRIFQFFEMKGGKVIVAELINTFDIFGYTTNVLKQVLNFMLKMSFIESPQGNVLENMRVLYSTDKLTFYYSTFSKMLVYLENIRNDCVIDYDAAPHYVRDGLCHDLLEVYKFIWYIMEQEQKEFRYIKVQGNHSLDMYKNMVADQPVAWKLLKSVQSRCEELFNSQRHLFPLSERQKVFDHSKQIYLKIIELCKEGEIWPAIPSNDLRRTADFMKNFTMI